MRQRSRWAAAVWFVHGRTKLCSDTEHCKSNSPAAWRWLSVATLVLTLPAGGQTTIVARETGSWMVHEEGLEEQTPQWDVTYVVTGTTILRTRLVDFRNGEIRTDNTQYEIIPLPLHDTKALVFNSVPEQIATMAGPVVRALGQPAMAAVEMLVIGPTFVRSVRSSAGYFVVTDMERRQ